MAPSSSDRNDCKTNRLIDKRVVGIARANIACLDFYKPREIDTHRLEGLVRVFQNTRCRRHDPDHYIPVVITPGDLKKALKASGLAQSDLTTPAEDGLPRFLKAAVNQRFMCLRGQHRTRAAQDILLASDQWWTIKIFVIKSQVELETFGNRWKNDYLHQVAYSSGEIYRNIRRLEKLEDGIRNGGDTWMDDMGDGATKEEWMARFTSSKQTAFIQLQKHKYFQDGLDRLLPFPGFWAALLMGNIQRHLALRCIEEIVTYFKHIEEVWTKMIFLSQDLDLRPYVCQQTVEGLQGRAPGANITDRNFVLQAMGNKILFPKIEDPHTRECLTKTLLTIEIIIPSIKTLHENLKYLEVGAKLLRRLVLGSDFQNSLYYSLKNAWIESDKALIQTDKGTVSVETSNAKESWELIYKGLWIFVLRDFADLGDHPPKMEKGQPLPHAEANPRVQHQLAKFAYGQGIRSSTLNRLLSQDPRKQKLRISMAQTFKLEADELDRAIDEMLHRLPLKEFHRESSSLEGTSVPRFEMDIIDRRWGVPFEHAYLRGRAEFYLPNIASEASVPMTMSSVTFILKDFMDAFFGPTDAFDILSKEQSHSQAQSPQNEVANSPGQQMDLDTATPPHIPTSKEPLFSYSNNSQARGPKNEVANPPGLQMDVDGAIQEVQYISSPSVASPLFETTKIFQSNEEGGKNQVNETIPNVGRSGGFSDLQGFGQELSTEVQGVLTQIQVSPPPDRPRSTWTLSSPNIEPSDGFEIPEPRLVRQADFTEMIEIASSKGLLEILQSYYRKAVEAQNAQLLRWTKIEEGFVGDLNRAPRFAINSLRQLKMAFDQYSRFSIENLASINRDIAKSFTGAPDSKGYVQIFYPHEPQLVIQEDWATIQKEPALVQLLAKDLDFGYLLQRLRNCYITLPESFKYLYERTRDLEIIKEMNTINVSISRLEIKMGRRADFGYLRLPSPGDMGDSEGGAVEIGRPIATTPDAPRRSPPQEEGGPIQRRRTSSTYSSGTDTRNSTLSISIPQGRQRSVVSIEPLPMKTQSDTPEAMTGAPSQSRLYDDLRKQNTVNKYEIEEMDQAIDPSTAMVVYAPGNSGDYHNSGTPYSSIDASFLPPQTSAPGVPGIAPGIEFNSDYLRRNQSAELLLPTTEVLESGEAATLRRAYRERRARSTSPGNRDSRALQRTYRDQRARSISPERREDKRSEKDRRGQKLYPSIRPRSFKNNSVDSPITTNTEPAPQETALQSLQVNKTAEIIVPEEPRRSVISLTDLVPQASMTVTSQVLNNRAVSLKSLRPVNSFSKTDPTLLGEVKTQQQHQTMDTGLTFFEYNGMRAKKKFLRAKDIPNHLSKRREWVMFIGAGTANTERNGWRTVPKSQIAKIWEKRPEMTYVLVSPDHIHRFQQKGWKILENTRNVRNTSLVRSKAVAKGVGPRYLILNDAEITKFDQNMTLLDCENRQRDIAQLLDSSQTCLLLYQNSSIRVLWVNEAEYINNRLQQVSSLAYGCRVSHVKKLLPCPIENATKAAKDFATWLILREQIGQFEIEQNDEKLTSKGDRLNAGPPQTGHSRTDNNLIEYQTGNSPTNSDLFEEGFTTTDDDDTDTDLPTPKNSDLIEQGVTTTDNKDTVEADFDSSQERTSNDILEKEHGIKDNYRAETDSGVFHFTGSQINNSTPDKADGYKSLMRYNALQSDALNPEWSLVPMRRRRSLETGFALNLKPQKARKVKGIESRLGATTKVNSNKISPFSAHVVTPDTIEDRPSKRKMIDKPDPDSQMGENQAHTPATTDS